MTFRQDCEMFAEFYDKKKKQRRLQRCQNYLDCWMCILALQDADFVTYLCHASAYTPLLCRFRELYVHWHGHQVYSEEVFFS